MPTRSGSPGSRQPARNGLANVQRDRRHAAAGARGLAAEAPFDVILLSGSVPEVPRELLSNSRWAAAWPP
jgi:protein-L-isoaspartate O-methyltransferase